MLSRVDSRTVGVDGQGYLAEVVTVVPRRRSVGLPVHCLPGEVDAHHVEEAAMAKVGLRDILSLEDRAAVMGLRRGAGQDQYLNSMEEIFAEADEEQRAMPHPWAVHDSATGALVGFAMISDNVPQPMDDDLVGPYYLWKLLIDHPFQRRGYGRATLDAVVDYLRTRPGADVLYTSCADGPGSPRGFYLRYGFTDTGRVMWDENLLALDLMARGSRAPGR
jgi:diamine N-acetyltransferase